MISIIILTYRPNFLNALLQNIPVTIGVPFETIVIDNRHGSYSLCSAYNKGIDEANGDFLCFVHEDVLFKSPNWGKELIDAMESYPNLGLIGIIGSKFKSEYPTGWYNPVNNCAYHVGNIIQGINSSSNFEIIDFSPGGNELDRVVCLDGVLLFTKKSVTNLVRFDESSFTGFHGYDIDFSLQVYFTGYEVAVLKSIKLLHYSTGDPNVQWVEANRLISSKWNNKLPTLINNNALIVMINEWKTRYIHSKKGKNIKILYAPIELGISIFKVIKNLI